VIPVLLIVAMAVSLQGDTQREAKRAWLGFGYTIHNFGPNARVRQWLYVRRVEPNSPAFTAGLRVQDAIVAIDRKAVNFASAAAALRFFAATKVDAVLELKVLREGRAHLVRVRAAELPSMYSDAWRKNEALARREDSSKKPR
jgi:S1-C subfamily serine protease